MAFKGSARHVRSGRASYGHCAQLDRMFELPMTTAYPDELPTVSLEDADQLADLHSPRLREAWALVEGQTSSDHLEKEIGSLLVRALEVAFFDIKWAFLAPSAPEAPVERRPVERN